MSALDVSIYRNLFLYVEIFRGMFLNVDSLHVSIYRNSAVTCMICVFTIALFTNYSVLQFEFQNCFILQFPHLLLPVPFSPFIRNTFT